MATNNFWGNSFNSDDIEFLVSEYEEFENQYDLSQYAEKIVAREICIYLLTIEKNRMAGTPNAKAIEHMMWLMKKLPVSPTIA